MKKNLLFILSIFILSISFVACSSKQSSNPFIGDWQGVRLDNQSGVYANETVVRNYKISIYQDGSFVVTESSSGSANYVYKYEGNWVSKSGSFANKKYVWLNIDGVDRIYNRGTTLYMTSDGSIYFPRGLDGLERIKEGNPEFRVTRNNSINSKDMEDNISSNISELDWIYGTWQVYTNELGLVTLVLNKNNTVKLSENEHSTSHNGRFEIKNSTLFCYFRTETTQLPLITSNQTIDLGNGYYFKKEGQYTTPPNTQQETIYETPTIIEDDGKIDTYLIDKKTYFHTEPDETTKTTLYLVEDDLVNVLEYKDDFGYVEFTNFKGQTTKGWLKLSDMHNP